MIRTVNSDNAIKFLYSYGGEIRPRRIDRKLIYFGGFTRVLAVDRSIKFSELMEKFGKSCGSSMILKCTLPGGDLDDLVKITCDEDLATFVEQYDKAASSINQEMKIRAVLVPIKSPETMSPPCSAVSSLDFSASKSPSFEAGDVYSAAYRHSSPVVGYPVGDVYPAAYRHSSPVVGFHVGVQQDAGKVRYYPCCKQGNPRNSYLVPHWNYRR